MGDDNGAPVKYGFDKVFLRRVWKLQVRQFEM